MTSPGPDWVEQARRFVISSGLVEALGAARPDGPPSTDDQPGHQAGEPAGECRRCPVCVGLAVLRGRRPELVEALADLLGTAAAVLRAHAGAAAADPPGPAPAEPAAEETVPTQPAPTQPAPVQRIDVA
jgi:hypothetical protein